MANPLEELMVVAAQASVDKSADRLFWATVAQTSPLRVREDGASGPIAASPKTLAAVQAGDRVLCLRFGRRLVILGRMGGTAPPEAEHGANGRGSWTKFPDGTLIQRLTTTVYDQPIQHAYGPLYQSIREWVFPIEFASPPVVSCSGFQWGTSASWGTLAGNPTTTQCVLRVMDIQARQAGTRCDISAVAVGRWK